MTLTALVLAFAALTAPAPARIAPEAAAAKIAACGFEHVTVRYDRTLQDQVLMVRKVRSVSPEKLECAARVALDARYFIFFPPKVDAQFRPLLDRLTREQSLAEARKWLDERGLLARLPAYDPQSADQAGFARALETLCGAAPGSVPLSGNASSLPTSGSAGAAEQEGKAFWCLIHAAEASGFPLGFVGNEDFMLVD